MSVPFDLTVLAAYLEAHVPGFRGPVQVAFIDGGQSNPTYHVHTEAARYVLRKKPAGTLLAGAHAVEREARVLRALAPGAVPVPEVLCLCEDASVIGTAFYLMRYVAGVTHWDPALPGRAPSQRAAMFDDMNRVLAAIHTTDVDAAGLRSFGKPGNAFEKQVHGWTRRYRDTETETIESMDRLIAWLVARIPGESPQTLIHGDYRMDNLPYDAAEPRIVAVLDWELSTLGDPVGDLAYHMMAWHLSADEFRGMAGQDLAALGIPSEAEYLAAYCARRGIALPSQGHWVFALACGMFRLAAILQGITHRAMHGNAAASNAVTTGRAARGVADAAWRLVQERETT